MSPDVEFSRLLLRGVLSDVRKAGVLRISEAWVISTSRGHWEFHYRDFYWHGRADNAFHARYHGWCAYLHNVRAPGYVATDDECAA
jgi:hypothetical protein